MIKRSLIFAQIVALAATAAFAIPRPNHPTGAAAGVPDALTPYERSVLQLEIVRLQREVAAARRETAASGEFAELRAAVAAAKAEGDAGKAAAASAALAGAVEAKLAETAGMREKIRRLKEVGALLEADTTRRKEQRANGGAG